MASVIRVLDQAVANRIAAGEVIERPASIVKELVENSIDAGARNLVVQLEDGGKRLIRVTDDGRGMSPEDLAICVLPHATSKIADVDDLFRISSFGFRGEALPSIGSIAELTILSREPGSELASRIRCSGGTIEGPVAAGGPTGTSVTVRDLFFNVPARRKFLKEARSELAQIVETLTRLFLPHPELGLKLEHEQKKGMDIREDSSRLARIRSLFGEELASRLLSADRTIGTLRIEAYFGPASLTKRTSEYQYVFLNGRFIRDKAASFAIKDGYAGQIMPKDHPVAFVFLTMPPDQFDVNVHPTKTEVRFRERDLLVVGIREMLRNGLARENGSRPIADQATRVAESPRRESRDTRGDVYAEMERELFGRVGDPPPPTAAEIARAREPESTTTRRTAHRCHSLVGSVMPEPTSHSALQIHRSYLLRESPQGLEILDQHALHERKLFDEWLARIDSATLEVQGLLHPEPVDLAPAEVALLSDRQLELERLGVTFTTLGPRTVLLQSLPRLLAKVTPSEVIEDLVVRLKEGAALGSDSLVREVAADLACRAAVKFGQVLPAAEIAALMAWRERNPGAKNCPHGRPVALHLDLRDLEQLFDRKK